MQTLETMLGSLADRVAILEAQNRRLKKAIIALLIVSSAVIGMGQGASKKIIEANEFVLRDASGKPRARLSMEVENRPTLSFYSDKGNLTTSLAGGDEPFLVLNKPGSTEQVQLGANKTFVGLGIYGKNIRAGLSVQKGVAALDLFDETQKPQISLNTSSNGPDLTMIDNGNDAFLSLNASGFTMNDSAGTPRSVLSTSQGKPSLTLSDKEGYSAVLGTAELVVPATGRRESTSAASVVLFDKGKKVLWSAP